MDRFFMICVASLSILLYALQNVLLDHYLKRFTPTALLVVFYCTMLPMALLQLYVQQRSGAPILWPTADWRLFALAIIGGFIFYWADWTFMRAYTLGADATTMATFLTLTPVVVVTIVALRYGIQPNWRMVAGYCIIVVGLWIFGTGVESRRQLTRLLDQPVSTDIGP